MVINHLLTGMILQVGIHRSYGEKVVKNFGAPLSNPRIALDTPGLDLLTKKRSVRR